MFLVRVITAQIKLSNFFGESQYKEIERRAELKKNVRELNENFANIVLLQVVTIGGVKQINLYWRFQPVGYSLALETSRLRILPIINSDIHISYSK